MQRTEVDGVPVFWADGPPPFAAGLVLGVGRGDEDFVHGGLTHLLEHLVMSSLGRTTLDANATVDLEVTEFLATGRPERVAEFLERVCLALADVPTGRLSTEADVLRAEEGHVAAPVVEALLGERYGVDGVGLAGYREPALLSLTADDVRAWAARVAVRGNAALWLSGPPPQGLRLPLPDGPRPVRPPQHRRDLVLPGLVEVPVEGTVALGGEVDRVPGLGTAVRVLSDRVEDDLRHRRGLTYTVATDQLSVEGERRFVVVTADVRDGQEAVAARALWQGLVRLAEQGPDEAELAHDREGLEEHLADPRSAVEEAHAAAVAHVRGRAARTSEELRQEAREVGVAQVRAAAALLRDAALLAVPAGVDAGLPALTRAPQWSPDAVTGRVFARRRRGDAPKGAELRVAGDGVSVVLSPQERLTVRYADAVGLLELRDGTVVLSDRDGWSVPLAAADWVDGEQALALVRGAVPEHLQGREDGVVPSGRSVLLLHGPLPATAEALWPGREAHVLIGPEWVLAVRPHDDVETYAEAAGVSAALGRKGCVLELVLDHGELELVVLHRGKEVDRHVWGGGDPDPAVLAGLLGRDAEQVRALLAHPGPPAAVLAELERVLGVPPQAARVLLGDDPAAVPGLVHEPARGLRAAVGAAVRGEYDPPDSTALPHRITRWRRERPPGYRAANTGFAAAQVGLAAAFATDDLTSGRGVLVVLLGLGALSSLWDARPPAKG